MDKAREEGTHAQIPTGGAVGRFIRHMLAEYRPAVAPTEPKIYLERLRSLPLGFLIAFNEAELQRRDKETEGPPTPDEFIAAWEEHGEDYLNPERVSTPEIPGMRRQVQAMVASRVGMIGTPIRTPDLAGTFIPQWARDLVRQLVAQAREAYPDGLPADQHQEVVASYHKRAGFAFDEEIRKQYDLEPIERPRDRVDPRESEELF